MTFEEWLIENHPEVLGEGKLTNALGALALAGSSLFGVSDSGAAEFKPDVSWRQVDSERVEAMRRASAGSDFKKNWGSEFDSVKERQVFGIILGLKTAGDHDEFSGRLRSDMKETIRVQLLGSGGPKDWRYELDRQRAVRSYDYQFLRYLQQLTIASKSALSQGR